MICTNTIFFKEMYRRKTLFILPLFVLQELFIMLFLGRYNSPSVKQSLLAFQKDNFIPYYEDRSLSWLFTD